MGGNLRLFWTQLNRICSRRAGDPSLSRRSTRTVHREVRSAISDIELLENRLLLSAVAAISHMTAKPTIDVLTHAATPAASGAVTPAQMQAAYGFNLVSLSSGANGTGQTIAIVDAYHDPTIQNDLKAFDTAYGLANPPSLTVMSQTGSTTNLPAVDPTANKADDWEVEESLDVEWAHALAPGAKIILVEANSASFADLMTAVHTAASLPGVSVVSMSWGGGEFASESAYDSFFTTPSGHQGVTFVASTGDSGSPGGFPAYSPNVLAVGGTTLTVSSSGAYVSESGWSSSGGGISQYEAQPTYQKGVVTQTTTRRAIPDVSFDADPNTGVMVYDSFSFGSSTPWGQIGGTSLSAPSWASVISIVNQGRAQNHLTTLDGATQTLPMLYQLESTNPGAFHDVTTGNNGFPAGVGYDLVTGLGTPVVNNLVNALDGSTSTTTAPKLAFLQTPATGTAGQALSPSVSVAIENQRGQVVTTDNSIVTISVNTGPGSLAATSTVSVHAVNGVATFSNLILDTAGGYTLSASDGSDTSGTSQTVTINAAQASKVVFQQQPSNGTVGQALPTIVGIIEDQFGNVVASNASTVTIAVASGPGGFSTSSTTSVKAVSGVATFNNLVLGATGTYTVALSDTGLIGATSASFTVGNVLSAPQNVAITAVSSTIAQLSWSSVNGASGYRIYVVSGSRSTLLGSVDANSTSVQITGLVAGATYSFKVEAYNATSFADSNVVSITMPTQSRTGPVLTSLMLSATSVELIWTPVAGTQGYRVYYSLGGHSYLLGTVPARFTSVIINGMTAGVSYQFMVEAYAGSTVQDSNWITVKATSASSHGVSKATGFASFPAGWAFDNRGRLLP